MKRFERKNIDGGNKIKKFFKKTVPLMGGGHSVSYSVMYIWNRTKNQKISVSAEKIFFAPYTILIEAIDLLL